MICNSSVGWDYERGLVDEMPTNETISRSRFHSGQVIPRFFGLLKPSYSGNPGKEPDNTQ